MISVQVLIEFVTDSPNFFNQSELKKQARDQEVQTLGVNPSYAPSTSSATMYSSDDHQSKSDYGGSNGKHSRRPSAALSFASTVPDDHNARERDLESGGAGLGGEHSKVKSEGNKSGEEVAKEDEPPKKFLGIFKRSPPKEPESKHRPDPTDEEMSPFPTSLKPSHFYELINPKNIQALTELGGTEGVLKGLNTDPKKGLNDEDKAGLEDRERVYGENRIPVKKGKSLLRLMWMAYQDKVLVRCFFFLSPFLKLANLAGVYLAHFISSSSSFFGLRPISRFRNPTANISIHQMSK